MLSKQFSNLDNVEIMPFKQYQEHSLGIEVVKFLDSENNRFVTGSHDQSVKLWDIKREQSIQTFSNLHDSGIWDLTIIPQQNQLLTVSPDTYVKLLDINSGKIERTFQTTQKQCYSISIKQDGKQFLVGGQDGDLILYDVMGEKIKIYKTYRYKDYWIVSTDNGYINIYDNDLNQIISQKLGEKEIRTFDVSMSRELYLSLNENHLNIYTIDFENKKINFKKTLEAHADLISSILINEKNNYLITGAKDHSIFVWKLDTLEYKHNLIGHRDLISCMDIQQQYLVTGSWDQKCCIFDMNKFI